MTPLEQLERRITDGSAVVGVVGLGYVGLPLADAIHSAGFRVIGFDSDPAKIEALNEGQTYLAHLGESLSPRLAASARFEVTGDEARFAECNAIVVCVPTPLAPDRTPDLSLVVETARAIGRALRPGQLIVLESTTYPGTTRTEFARAVCGEKDPERLGVAIAYSPEREDPGNLDHTTRSIPKLVGGLDERATKLAAALYSRAIAEVIPVSSAEVAESAKMLENIYRAVNIALVNEMKTVFDAMEIDVWEVVRAAATKPFGFTPFWPGPGLGGHCIPVDPFYFAWKAREVGRPTRFVELAGEVNHAMPGYVVDRTASVLEEAGVALDGASVLVLGLAYKPDIGDVRESPSFELIRLLRERGARVSYSDPHVPKTWKMRRYDLGLTSVTLGSDVLRSMDAVVIATAHRSFDYGLLAEHAQLIVDTRDAMRQYEPAVRGRLVRA
ncbi:MAG: nucleotide sugar dehydrogenase [Planctomycetota bacterium]